MSWWAHRAKLVGLRSGCMVQIHAVLAKCGIQVATSGLFGVEGTALLDRVALPAPYAARIASLRRVIDGLDFEIDQFARLTRGRLATEPGYTSVQQIPEIGPTLGVRVRGRDRRRAPVHQRAGVGLVGGVDAQASRDQAPTSTAAGSPSKAPAWSAGRRPVSVKKVGAHTQVGALRERVAQRRGRNIGSVAAARRQVELVYYALRDGHVRALDHLPRSAA